jgi:hypothetical protein
LAQRHEAGSVCFVPHRFEQTAQKPAARNNSSIGRREGAGLSLKTEMRRGEMAQCFETGGDANGQDVFNQYLAVHLQLLSGQMIVSDRPFPFRFSG